MRCVNVASFMGSLSGFRLTSQDGTSLKLDKGLLNMAQSLRAETSDAVYL